MSCLHRREPAEKTPRQPRVVDQDNPLSSGNHAGYIANRSGFDNEAGTHAKGADKRPLPDVRATRDYSRAAASAPSGPAAPWASEMRAFLPRNPRR